MLTYLINFLLSKRLILLLTIVLRLFIHLENQHTFHCTAYTHLEQLYGKNHMKNCYELQIQLENDPQAGIHNTLNYLFFKNARSKRLTQILRTKIDGTKFIAKTSTKSVNILKNLTFPLNRDVLMKKFLTQSPNLDFQFCPHENIQNFIDYLSVQSDLSETTVWFLMLTNVQLLLQTLLEKHNFPVPKIYGVCGLSVYQEYLGNTLQYFEYGNFQIKLRIAKQLLDAAFKFTNGIKGYHIYITDLTSDNLIYNPARDKLYFIDLDTIYMVDGNNTNESEMFDYHDYIECSNNCFAFVPDRLCTNGLSDLNILAACLYLRGNLKKDGTKGFLHPITEKVLRKYSNLLQLLDDCVGASVYDETSNFDRKSRFIAAAKLSELFTSMLIN